MRNINKYLGFTPKRIVCREINCCEKAENWEFISKSLIAQIVRMLYPMKQWMNARCFEINKMRDFIRTHKT